MAKRRVSAGGVKAWGDALAYLGSQLRVLLLMAGVISATIVVSNVVPRVPTWEKGFTTGFLFASALGFVWWIAWVPSGLAMRSMGLLAEEWTGDLIRKVPGVWSVTPSFKFEGKDVDHVAVSASGIVAIETKWRSKAPRSGDVEHAAFQAADAGRSLRLNLRRGELPEPLFTNALIYWGPGTTGFKPHVIQTSKGAVAVMSGLGAKTWLEGLSTGHVGRDYGETLGREVQLLAEQRDRHAIKAPRLIKWLAKAK